MIGAFLNALGILLGSLFGLARREPLSPRLQNQFKTALGALTAFCGLQLLWLNVGGSAFVVLKQLFLACLSVILGNLLGKLLGLQKMSNFLGRHAASLLAGAQTSSTVKPLDGFKAVTILFCATPLGLVGAITDGLGNYFVPLALKAVMDGLAMTSFVKIFRWPSAMAAVPVFLFLNGLALAVHTFVLPQLSSPELVHSVNAAAGPADLFDDPGDSGGPPRGTGELSSRVVSRPDIKQIFGIKTGLKTCMAVYSAITWVREAQAVTLAS